MRTKGRSTGSPAPREGARRWLGALAGCVLVASTGFALLLAGPREPPAVPDADRSLMEPQVAAKVESYRQAVFAAPESDESWGNLGIVFLAHGLAEEAAVCFRRALEREPAEFRWHYLLVHALRPLDRDQALEASQAALAVRSDYAPVYVVAGELLVEQGAVEKAKEMYARALSLDPGNAMAALGLGRIESERGNLEEAREHLERARKLSPEARSVHALLARLYRRLGDPEQARAAAEVASRVTGTVAIEDPIHFRMTQESVSSTALLERARSAEESGDLATAEKMYRELVVLRPEDADIRIGLGDLLIQRNAKDEAKEHYRSALAQRPDHPAALYGLATVLSLEGDYNQAIPLYRKALEAGPDHVLTLQNLAGLLAFQGQHEEAFALYDKALAIDPDKLSLHRALGELRFKLHEYDRAAHHFRKALAVNPDLGPVHLRLGASLAMMADFENALFHLGRARELGERVPPDLYREVEQRAR